MPLVYANMRMSEVVSKHLSLIPVINRFGIRLGVGDETVMALCEANDIDTDFFRRKNCKTSTSRRLSTI